MSLGSEPADLPRISSEPVEVGAGAIGCTLCPDVVPVPVRISVGYDERGVAALITEPVLLDLELHMATHD
jgi:hypothetical protein